MARAHQFTRKVEFYQIKFFLLTFFLCTLVDMCAKKAKIAMRNVFWKKWRRKRGIFELVFEYLRTLMDLGLQLINSIPISLVTNFLSSIFPHSQSFFFLFSVFLKLRSLFPALKPRFCTHRSIIRILRHTLSKKNFVSFYAKISLYKKKSTGKKVLFAVICGMKQKRDQF